MIVFVIIAIGLFLTASRKRGRTSGDEIPGYAFGVAGGIALVIAAIMFGLNFFTKVPANSVGIVTAFGKPVGTVSSGLQFLDPWESVDTFSTRVQITERLQAANQGDQSGNDCVEVNLNGGASACADMTIRYVINPEDAVALWQRYGDFNTVRDSLLRSATNNAAKIVFGKFKPQDAISGAALPQITTQMTNELKNQLADSGLTLVAVAPGQLHLSENVQNQINEILNAQTNATVAQQNLAVSQAQAQANQALTNSLSPQILAEDCFKAAEQIKPTVFNCDFNGSGTSTTPVIVNGK